jgi:hypothetical protein
MRAMVPMVVSMQVPEVGTANGTTMTGVLGENGREQAPAPEGLLA